MTNLLTEQRTTKSQRLSASKLSGRLFQTMPLSRQTERCMPRRQLAIPVASSGLYQQRAAELTGQ
jgi:hypothetical protein